MIPTTLSLSLRTTKQLKTIATVSILSVTYFAIIIVTLHFLRPDLNPISQPTSQYAVGTYGFLMTSAFFCMSIASFALLIGLYQGLPQPARSRMGLGLLGLWGVGVLIAMLFPIDPEGSPQTIAGTIHRINGPLAFLSATLSTILLSKGFQQDESWRPVHGPARILSWVMLAAYIAGFLSIVTDSGFAGLTQRMDLAALVTWMLLTAARLRTLALGSVSA
jgi:hypothetical protein